ncbi:MAG: hypothetical protein RLZZ592_1172 [Pseudomonadota bacterium]|nr:hypothetical protein [Pseudomonadota bacterium]
MELYVYYRIAPADEAAFWQDREAIAPQLAARFPGLRSRWLRRPEVRDGALTLMEVHRRDGGLTAAETDALGEMLADWPRQRIGPRHVEVFVDPFPVPCPDSDVPCRPCD